MDQKRFLYYMSDNTLDEQEVDDLDDEDELEQDKKEALDAMEDSDDLLEGDVTTEESLDELEDIDEDLEESESESMDTDDLTDSDPVEDESGGILKKIGSIFSGESEDAENSDLDVEEVAEKRDRDITITPFTESVSDERMGNLNDHQERVGFGVEIVIGEEEWSQISDSNVVHGMVYDTTSELTVDGGKDAKETIDNAEQVDRDGDKVLRHWIDSRIIDVDSDSIEPNIEYQVDGSALVWVWTTNRDMNQSDIAELDLDVNAGTETDLSDELRNYVSGNANVPNFEGHLRTPTIRKIEFGQQYTEDL